MPRTLVVIATLCLCVPATAKAQSADEVALAKQVLSEIQHKSIKRNREYCGLIGYDASGQLMATEPRRGHQASCRPRPEPDGMEVTASYHTHAAYRQVYDNEVPSVIDVEGDMGDGINGFVATPGGRLWFIDGETGVSRLLCGPRCLPSDAGYRADPDDPVAERYSLQELRWRNGE